MGRKSFTILVPYNGIMTIAQVEQQESHINFNYRVKFDNGFITEFNTYEPENEEQFGWNESGFGETELAKQVGTAIDFYNQNEVEPFTVNIDNVKYFILPVDEKDQVFYHVYRNKFICVMALNENGQWEANNDYDEIVVRKLGAAIESLNE